ncbi:hypothetical protein B2J93_5125 [Marssonina coronariae]|uniref:Major facilitator superfamily (MFS) profile domain-containing protein n=1 Tax=Diplocarpon coronariae TaxID=2795749 RepID=A0A218ZHK9_9HELO|nr:hypothetical protein B2J93_5125 [Marssonina coronariae]
MTVVSKAPGEATPLLTGSRQNPQRTTSAWKFQVTSPRGITIIVAFAFVILGSGGTLVIVPTTRILEDVLCHRFYDTLDGRNGAIDEKLCKRDEIQSELAYLTGLIASVEAAVGFAFAFPYGILADKIGRKPIFLLTMVGVMLAMLANFAVLRFWRTIPIHLIIYTSIFEVIGGGTPVTTSVLYSIVADVNLPANRASAFSVIALATFAANLIGPVLASRLVQTVSPWVPLCTTLVLLPIGTALIFIIPETLPTKSEAEEDLPQEQSIISSVTSHLQHTLAQLFESFTMLKSTSLAIILFTFLQFMPSVLGITQFFLQYFSKRFGWPLAQTGYLLSIRGIASVFTLLVALPGLSKLLMSPRLPFRFTAARKDLLLAQCSAAVATLGVILLGGPSISIVLMGILVATLGDGLAPLTRALIAAFVDPQHTSRIYTLVGMVEAIGAMFAGPSLAYFFTKGMEWKGLWLGLPYLWLACLSGLVVIAFGFVNLESAVQKAFVEEEIVRPGSRGEGENV